MAAGQPERVAFGVLLAALCLSGCTEEAWIGRDRVIAADAGRLAAGGVATSDGSTSGGRSPGSAGAPVCERASCQNHIYACGDCVDNDGDGKIDMDDPDCLGPCQNAEDSFFFSIPGQNHAGCVTDCYFDQDNGFGNDGCLWSSQCDPRAPDGASCPYDPNAKLPRQGDCVSLETTQVAECTSVCGPLTPNGCDCFGCCEIPGAKTPVWVGSVDELGNPTCDLAHIADPTRCRPCTQVAACRNPCDVCERCVGKTELPASCGKGAACPAPACSGGAQPCGDPCLSPCSSGEACITGCCVPTLR